MSFRRVTQRGATKPNISFGRRPLATRPKLLRRELRQELGGPPPEGADGIAPAGFLQTRPSLAQPADARVGLAQADEDGRALRALLGPRLQRPYRFVQMSRSHQGIAEPEVGVRVVVIAVEAGAEPVDGLRVQLVLEVGGAEVAGRDLRRGVRRVVEGGDELVLALVSPAG